jgi:flagellar L-ring protein precursor FlgH
MSSRNTQNSRRTALIVGYSVYAVIASAWMARSDSLFPIKEANRALKGSTSATASSLFSDVRAHNVGDILYVTVAEATSAQSSASTKVSKDEDVSLLNGTGLFNRLFKEFSFGASNARSANGTGQTSRTGSLVTALSVTVKEVLPNGIIRIEGSRLVTINKETQKVIFSGVVRPEDIGTDNSIPSTLVADANIRYEGKGTVADTQKPGILTRIFRFLF